MIKSQLRIRQDSRMPLVAAILAFVSLLMMFIDWQAGKTIGERPPIQAFKPFQGSMPDNVGWLLAVAATAALIVCLLAFAKKSLAFMIAPLGLYCVGMILRTMSGSRFWIFLVFAFLTAWAFGIAATGESNISKGIAITVISLLILLSLLLCLPAVVDIAEDINRNFDGLLLHYNYTADTAIAIWNVSYAIHEILLLVSVLLVLLSTTRQFVAETEESAKTERKKPEKPAKERKKAADKPLEQESEKTQKNGTKRAGKADAGDPFDAMKKLYNDFDSETEDNVKNKKHADNSETPKSPIFHDLQKEENAGRKNEQRVVAESVSDAEPVLTVPVSGSRLQKSLKEEIVYDRDQKLEHRNVVRVFSVIGMIVSLLMLAGGVLLLMNVIDIQYNSICGIMLIAVGVGLFFVFGNNLTYKEYYMKTIVTERKVVHEETNWEEVLANRLEEDEKNIASLTETYARMTEMYGKLLESTAELSNNVKALGMKAAYQALPENGGASSAPADISTSEGAEAEARRIEAELLEIENEAERRRVAEEQAAAVRAMREQEEAERIAREAALEAAREQAAREAAERAEQERLAREAAERAEQERLAREAAERAEQERLAREAEERAFAEEAARKHAEWEAAEAARLRAEQEEAERAASEILFGEPEVLQSNEESEASEEVPGTNFDNLFENKYTGGSTTVEEIVSAASPDNFEAYLNELDSIEDELSVEDKPSAEFVEITDFVPEEIKQESVQEENGKAFTEADAQKTLEELLRQTPVSDKSAKQTFDVVPELEVATDNDALLSSMFGAYNPPVPEAAPLNDYAETLSELPTADEADDVSEEEAPFFNNSFYAAFAGENPVVADAAEPAPMPEFNEAEPEEAKTAFGFFSSFAENAEAEDVRESLVEAAEPEAPAEQELFAEPEASVEPDMFAEPEVPAFEAETGAADEDEEQKPVSTEREVLEDFVLPTFRGFGFDSMDEAEKSEEEKEEEAFFRPSGYKLKSFKKNTEWVDEDDDDDDFGIPKLQNEPELPMDDEPELPMDDEPELPMDDEPELPMDDEPELPMDDEPELPMDDEPELPMDDEPELPDEDDDDAPMSVVVEDDDNDRLKKLQAKLAEIRQRNSEKYGSEDVDDLDL